MLNQFKDRVVRQNGTEVFRRMEEQLVSNDWGNSNCFGLVAYVLGFKSRNVTGFMFDRGNLDRLYSRHLVALGDEWGLIVGNREEANICFWRCPGLIPKHAAFYLGEGYVFHQMPGDKPFTEQLPHTYCPRILGREVRLFPSEYYLIEPKV